MSYQNIAERPLADASNLAPGYEFAKTPGPLADPAEKMSVVDPIDYSNKEYERSNVQYAKLSYGVLVERGLTNAAIDRLMGLLPAGSYIAGGSVASLVTGNGLVNADDIDVFFAAPDAYKSAFVALARAGYRQVFGAAVPQGVDQFQLTSDSRVADLYKPIQLINARWFSEGAEEVIDGFDMTCTQFAIDVSSKVLVFNPVAPLDYQAKRLVLHRMEDNITTQKRFRKYGAKGFRPAGTTTLERAAALGIRV
jgi:hypothetical protein